MDDEDEPCGCEGESVNHTVEIGSPRYEEGRERGQEREIETESDETLQGISTKQKYDVFDNNRHEQVQLVG